MTRLVQIMAGARHGGAEAFFTRLAISLQAAGTEQHLLIRRDPARAARLIESGIGVSEYRFGGPLDIATRLGIRRELKRLKPRVVLSWMNRATGLTPRGPYTLAARLGGYYDLKYYRHCDHLIGNTRDIVAYLRRKGWPEERSHYLPNFVDATRAPPVSRASLTTPEDAPLLLALGRLHPVKGFDVLLAALTAVPDAFVWLAGEGPERQALEAQAQALGLSARVRFLGWRDDMAALLAAADLLVCPSRHEPLGNVVIEAWAHGVPVIASDAEGPRELIQPGIDGFLAARDNADALARTIRLLLADPAAREALAQAGYESYSRQFSERTVVAAYQEFFDRVAR
jgi:glycosyltransferase involved in cell wall biosynthesis